MSNSCGVLVAYLCKTYFVLNRQKWRKFDSWYHVRSVYSDKSVNANTEIAQVKILKELQKLVKKLDISQNKRIIFANLFNSKSKIKSGKTLMKRKCIAKLVETKVSLDICDIWTIRNANTWNFTFRQNQFIGFIEHRLD